METETYKNAKLILERFDPEAKKKAVSVCLCVSVFVCACVCACLSVIVSLFSLTEFAAALQELESTPVRPQMTPRPGQGTTHINTQRTARA